MNSTGCVAVGLLALATLLAPQDGPGREPPDRLYITHAGKRIDVELGKPFSLEVGGEQIELRLDVGPTRIFETDTFRFEYPRNLAYSYDAEEPESWDLDGSDAVIMVQRHGAAAEGLLEALVESVAERYEDAFAGKAPVEVDLGGRKHAGTRITMAIGQLNIFQDVVVIPAESCSWVLIIQDSPDDDGSPSTEMTEVRKLLARTWKIK